MKNFLLLSFLLCLFLAGSPSASAVVSAPRVEKVESEESSKMSKADRKALKRQLKQEQKKARLEKRWNKLEQKLEKRGITIEKQTTDIWDDNKFRLGVILLAGAIVLGLVAVVLSFSGFFNFIAGLFALAGIVLIIWSLLENY